jgi:predicted amidohydrolase
MDAMRRRTFISLGGAGLVAAAEASDSANSSQSNPEGTSSSIKNVAIITLVQLQSEGKNTAPVDRMPSFFEQAAGLGADLVVFPEYVLGDTIDTGHENARRFFDLARTYHINAITGCVEAFGEKYATSAWVVNRDGILLGRYLKCHPAAGPAPHWWPPIEGHDREARGILGNQFKVFHLDFGPIGILQCYDGYFPEAWGCTSYSGAEIILWINGRQGMVEDSHCICAAQSYGCVVGANITDGCNTGFAGSNCITPLDYTEGREEARLYPRIKQRGDAAVTASIDLGMLRTRRKHLRTMHQRRPELYGLLTQDIKMWQDYPDIPWEYPECADLVNRSQLT